MSANDILALQTMEELLLVMQDQLAVEVRQRGLCISPNERATDAFPSISTCHRNKRSPNFTHTRR